MLTRWSFVQRSLLHHWRSNLAIALGVAAATAVLSGALMVGDSMRWSLRELTLDRLGEIDQLLVSDSFFREELANELVVNASLKGRYDQVEPVILFPGGTVENESGQGRSSNVTVIGVTKAFAKFDRVDNWKGGMPTGEQVIVNRPLADDLGISAEDVASGRATVTLRIPKRGQLPSDSSLGKKDGLIESLVNLPVKGVVPAKGLGRFGLHPTQADPLNIYVPIDLLQEALSRTVLRHKATPQQANMLLLAGKDQSLPNPVELKAAMEPALEDLGLVLNRANLTFGEAEKTTTIYDYWSLSSERLVMNDTVVDAVNAVGIDPKPVFTYLANDMRVVGSSAKSGIPFSMIASIDFDKSFQPISALSGQPIAPLKKNEMVLNRWAADDLDAKPGDAIEVVYFEPESKGGNQVEREVTFILVDVATLVEPSEPAVVRRRGRVIPAKYDQEPAVTNDMQLTPEVPGLTDAVSIENWDLPFETAGKIRSQDDEYWTDYRTTPKAFVSLETGQELWQSRFGKVTSFRISNAGQQQSRLQQGRISRQLMQANGDIGLDVVPIKQRSLAAASGSTPFDVLFLALSMFVIASALILVALLFRLALQQRSSEFGTMAAVGLNSQLVRRTFMIEMLCVAAVGALVGILLGVGYAATMVHGLTTWWVGAISRPFLKLHISPWSLLVGLLIGLLICAATIFWSLRLTRNQNVISLLAGHFGEDSDKDKPIGSRSWLVWLLVAIAFGFSVLATKLVGEAQAGAFMGAGFFVLVALLVSAHQWLARPINNSAVALRSLSGLAGRAASRNALRSTLTIGLVAVASFLIVAVSSFRLSPSEAGTAGFDWIATSSQPIIDPVRVPELDGDAVEREGFDSAEPASIVYSFRYQSGEDASCNNLYQSTQPQVLGVPNEFIDSFDLSSRSRKTSKASEYRVPGRLGDSSGRDAKTNGSSPQAAGLRSTRSFAWAATQASTEAEQANPWHLIDGEAHQGTADDPIPVIIDKNTANYSLKIYFPGTQFQVDYDSGERVHFVAVGFLANTILQGSLVTSEQNFLKVFPSTAGYRYFLIREAEDSKRVASLEERFEDYGFDARSATKTLAGFMAVQNTYLSTFQSLGGLGLLLGTFGLAAVQLRSILERKRELALMQAVGFGPDQLSRMILMENVWLLAVGLGIGVLAALFATLPHWWLGEASVPWVDLVLIFAAVVVVGLLAAGLASRVVARMPLLESLRV